MEPITIRFEDSFIKDLEKLMKKHRYSTKAEFIREAIREKMRELEKQGLLMKAEKLYGASKRKTTDEELHRAGKSAFKELEKETDN